VLKTARVRLGAGVLVGTGSVVGIGVTAEPGAQVGALTVVPKFRRLAAGTVSVGVPARTMGGAGAPDGADGRTRGVGTGVRRSPPPAGAAEAAAPVSTPGSA